MKITEYNPQKNTMIPLLAGETGAAATGACLKWLHDRAMEKVDQDGLPSMLDTPIVIFSLLAFSDLDGKSFVFRSAGAGYFNRGGVLREYFTSLEQTGLECVGISAANFCAETLSYILVFTV